ncbi:hypothetical protein PTKIN_Ptkin03bG0140600 [Pterospermum kingtungense]
MAGKNMSFSALAVATCHKIKVGGHVASSEAGRLSELQRQLLKSTKKENYMEKTKRMSLGVQKKTKLTKQNKKKFLNDVLHYLKSDCYMFAPLISSSFSGVKMKEPIKGDQKRVLKKVGEYMKSDTYMYAPLVSSQLTGSPPSGQTQCIRKVTMEVSRRMLNLKENHQSTEPANVIADKQPCKDSCPGTITADNETVGREETVKHVVYQHCRSSSMSGKAMVDLQPRKLVE